MNQPRPLQQPLASVNEWAALGTLKLAKPHAHIPNSATKPKLAFLQKLISLRTSMMETSCGVVTTTAPSTRAALRNCSAEEGKGVQGHSQNCSPRFSQRARLGRDRRRWCTKKEMVLAGTIGTTLINITLTPPPPHPAAAATQQRQQHAGLGCTDRPELQPSCSAHATHLHDGDVFVRGAGRRIDHQIVAGAPVHVLEEPANRAQQGRRARRHTVAATRRWMPQCRYTGRK